MVVTRATVWLDGKPKRVDVSWRPSFEGHGSVWSRQKTSGGRFVRDHDQTVGPNAEYRRQWAEEGEGGTIRRSYLVVTVGVGDGSGVMVVSIRVNVECSRFYDAGSGESLSVRNARTRSFVSLER